VDQQRLTASIAGSSAVVTGAVQAHRGSSPSDRYNRQRIKLTFDISCLCVVGPVLGGGILTLGYFIGEDWRRVAELVHRDLLYGSLAVIAVVLLYLLVQTTRRTQSFNVVLLGSA
jgi:hypothetical protein